MKIRLSITAALFAVGLLSSPAFAQTRGCASATCEDAKRICEARRAQALSAATPQAIAFKGSLKLTCDEPYRTCKVTGWWRNTCQIFVPRGGS